MKKVLIIVAIIMALPLIASARPTNQITDWYLKDFHSEIRVNYDSSLDITENITADCGNLPDKHGIFRILPTRYTMADGKKINMPLNLNGITDGEFALPYDITKKIGSITYKIFSAQDRGTVTGENKVVIDYTYKNTIRFDNNDFDELYWNLNGNFWEIQTDNYSAEIILPKEINQNNSKIYIYTGQVGQKYIGLANYYWDTNRNSIVVSSTRTLKAGEGITISVTFPKGIITPYQPTWEEKINNLLILSLFIVTILIPIIVLLFCFFFWKKYGKDLKLNKAITPEYEPPLNLSPLEISFLKYGGNIPNNDITATIINLAVKGYLKIDEYKKKKYSLTYIEKNTDNLNEAEKIILEAIFKGSLSMEGVVRLEKLRGKISTITLKLKPTLQKKLTDDGLFDPEGFKNQKKLSQIAGLMFLITIGFSVVIIVSKHGIFLPITFGLIASTIIVSVFASLMAKITPLGAETLWKVKGFKLYMKTAEKYRQQFYEKENIFEKLLPYAISFGLTKEWIKKMEQIYGSDYFNNYHPLWYSGVGSIGSFDANSFASSISSITSSMNAATGSSGAGGGGGS
ncbi:MAG: hypothetical protein COU81_00165, partial [Candidatus Portnoybacteria bacterium CG10_big_fil_rev_8_21_14_0_10_36_7]